MRLTQGNCMYHLIIRPDQPAVALPNKLQPGFIVEVLRRSKYVHTIPRCSCLSIRLVFFPNLFFFSSSRRPVLESGHSHIRRHANTHAFLFMHVLLAEYIVSHNFHRPPVLATPEFRVRSLLPSVSRVPELPTHPCAVHVQPEQKQKPSCARASWSSRSVAREETSRRSVRMSC